MERRQHVVVGAGLLGLCTAAALTAWGRDVLVLERHDVGHALSGSKGVSRIFRLGYEDPEYVAMAMAAGQRWRLLEDRAGTSLLTVTGQLSFAERLDPLREAMEAAGAPCRHLGAEEVAERFPGLRFGGPAVYEPDSGVLAAAEALEALARVGGELRAGTTVTGLHDDGREVTIDTTDDRVTAATVVLCPGAWSAPVAALAGVRVETTPTLEQVAYFRPGGGARHGALPVFIRHGHDSAYGLPTPGSDLYKVAFHGAGPVVDPDEAGRRPELAEPDPTIDDRLSGLVESHLPSLDPTVVTSERCFYDNTADGDFVLDRVGRVVLGAGTSGHGFKFGPLLGEQLAALATDRPPDPPVGRFRLGRTAPLPPSAVTGDVPIGQTGAVKEE
ncbi:MAG TPA: FAD-dependent oxidoreductase [Acidimicrobiales bacterium]|nr:FAD-dependent oxidoreductase [Acidimicrobiales bacterium]